MSKFAYVGTYSAPNGRGNGIYIYEVDPATGSLNFLETAETESASFLCFNRKRDRLYAVNELNQHEGQNGEITAFKVDPSTGKLTKMNKVSSLGTWPCHLCLDPSEKFVLAANYGTGSVVVYSLKPDGALDRNTDLVTNVGSGPNPQRQEGAHAHMIVFDRQGKQARLVDLGLDRMLFYGFDSAIGKLVRQPGECSATPGAGPRQFAESPDGGHYYIINELDSTMSVFSTTKRSDGHCPLLQTISTLPPEENFTENNQPSGILLHPSGKFLYGSNRGHDSIVIYAIDDKTGLLTLVGHEPTQGSWPRHFQIHPSGKLLYAANQNSDNIVLFRIDLSTGKLTPTGQKTHIPSPVCIVFN